VLKEPAHWIIVGLIGGALWGWYARWLGLRRRAVAALAPVIATSAVLWPLLMGDHYEDKWTFVPLVIATMPAVLAAFVVTRASWGRPCRWRCATAVVLLPGVIVCLLGLRPGRVRYAAETRFVDQVAPVVRQYLREQGDCPDAMSIFALEVDHEASPDPEAVKGRSLTFGCYESGFGFCIVRYPYEEPVQCWDSESGQWWFERALVGGRPQSNPGD